MNNLEELQENIGYKFNDIKLLQSALTHKSYLFENKIKTKILSERLEFLGDAVLEIVVSEYIYKTYNNLSEGEMTKVRASTVCEKSIVEIAKRFNFGDFLRLGKGELAVGARSRVALLADTVESILGAIYLDSNYETIYNFILRLFKDMINANAKNIGKKDFKTELQEFLQAKEKCTIKYETIKEYGPDHAKIFDVQVIWGTKILGQGSGKTKKEAEQMAAEVALRRFLWEKLIY